MARFLFCIVSFGTFVVLSNCLFPVNKASFYKSVNNTAESLYRITNIRPIIYDLQFTPFLIENNFTFTGRASITFELLDNATEVNLNAVDLTIGRTVTLQKNGTLVNISSISTDAAYERLTVQVEQGLEAGRYTLKIPYTGLIRNTTDGRGFFYGTHYVDGNLTYYAATQFEPMRARKAFPSFDEPGLRAQVMVSITRYPNQTTISNMNRGSNSSIVKADGTIMDVYNLSPRMPTYLVAFFVGQFARYSSNDSFYSVYARPDAIDEGQAEYALSLMGPVVDTLTNFVHVNYTLPKLDIVALPDFSGAMENWGMTTFRESYSLFKEGISTEYYKDMILQVISHEFGHQWFGNLVTTEWWGNIWLNEGFAAYCQHTISALIEPTWRYDEAFSLRAVQIGLEADVDDTHAMTYTAYSSSDLKFDDISYEKAGSVLKMVEHTVTLDVFKKALNAYLLTTNASGGVSTPSLLFAAIEDQVQNSSTPLLRNDFNFTTFIESWTLVPGFPLITVDVTNESVTVKQERFSPDGVTYNSSWYVPLTFTTQEDKDFKTLTPKAWITPGDSFVNVSSPPSGWVIFNILQSGFYRVNYDVNNWNKLAQQLKEDHTQIPAVNRGQLIDDAFYLAKANYLNYSIVFSLVEYLRNETDYIPWQVAMKHFKQLLFYFQGTELSTQLKAYVRDLYAAYYNLVATVSSDDHMVLLGRTDALQFACDLEYTPCINYTKHLFSMWLSSEINFPPEKKTGALCSGLREDASQVIYVYNKYKASNVFSDKIEFLKALACIEDNQMLQTIMATAFLDQYQTDIRVQDKAMFFIKIIDNPSNIDMVISFVKSYFPFMVTALGERSARNLVSLLGSKLILSSHVQIVEEAINDKYLSQELRDTFNASLPAAKARLSWAQTYISSVSAALAMAQNDDTPSASNNLHYSLANMAVALLIIWKIL